MLSVNAGHGDGFAGRHPVVAESAGEYEDGRDGVCGVILAGSYHWGEGTFERLLRGPLVSVAQTPVICYSLGWLRSAGVRQAVVCANSATPAVRRYLDDGRGLSMELQYFEDDEPRGPAGCVRDAMLLSPARTFVVCEGLLVPSVDLRAVLDAHERSGNGATVVVETDRRRKAIADGEPPRLPGGIWVFDRRMLAAVPARGFFDIKQGLLDRLYDQGERALMYQVAGLSPRVMDFATYVSVSRWLIGRAVERPDLLSSPHLRVGEGLRHHTARVDPAVQLIGPVLLGPRVEIQAGAVIVGPTTIGADTVIHSGALVCRSIVWERCVIGRDAVIDGSLLADDAVVGDRERLVAAARIVDASVLPSERPALSLPRPVSIPTDIAYPFRHHADPMGAQMVDLAQLRA